MAAAGLILADTSIWIDHLRGEDTGLQALLAAEGICCHPFIVGEVALGSLKNSAATLDQLKLLPMVPAAHTSEVAAFVEWAKLFGTGIDYVDAHLLTSVRLSEGTRLWTRDKRLRAQAERLGVAFTP